MTRSACRALPAAVLASLAGLCVAPAVAAGDGSAPSPPSPLPIATPAAPDPSQILGTSSPSPTPAATPAAVTARPAGSTAPEPAAAGQAAGQAAGPAPGTPTTAMPSSSNPTGAASQSTPVRPSAAAADGGQPALADSRGMVPWSAAPHVVLPPGSEPAVLGLGLILIPLLAGAWTLLLARVAGIWRRYRSAGLRQSLAAQLGITPAELGSLSPAALARLREQVAFDELTGVMRRAAGVHALRREMARARRQRTPLTVAFVDVDSLKQVNDSQGHEAGDALLRDVAGMLQRRLRREDLVFRYGGDEFVAVLPGSDRTASERVLSEVLGSARAQSRSFSYGIAEMQPVGGVQTLLNRADAELYRGRSLRRGRPTPGPVPLPRSTPRPVPVPEPALGAWVHAARRFLDGSVTGARRGVT